MTEARVNTADVLKVIGRIVLWLILLGFCAIQLLASLQSGESLSPFRGTRSMRVHVDSDPQLYYLSVLLKCAGIVWCVIRLKTYIPLAICYVRETRGQGN